MPILLMVAALSAYQPQCGDVSSVAGVWQVLEEQSFNLYEIEIQADGSFETRLENETFSGILVAECVDGFTAVVFEYPEYPEGSGTHGWVQTTRNPNVIRLFLRQRPSELEAPDFQDLQLLSTWTRNDAS